MMWTSFYPRIFMDYYSPETPLADGTRKLASSESLLSFGFIEIFDVGKRVAEIPGGGETGRISFTAADDVGGFVAAACSFGWRSGRWGSGRYVVGRILHIKYSKLRKA
jgi:hypothetical protein